MNLDEVVAGFLGFETQGDVRSRETIGSDASQSRPLHTGLVAAVA
jgi:hypothetical protein